MGGIPVLVMMAAAGITYGWRPDDRGGVEYLIQIPPEQIDQLEQIGEITSVIDPEVRGHVSRVIIQVGRRKLPRQTPTHLIRKPQDAGSLFAASDHSPVPIPEMDDSRQAAPIPSPAAAVMKPQAADSGGFGFPTGSALPSALQDAASTVAEGIRTDVDRAGRDITNRAASQIGNALRQNTAERGPIVPPPSTRTPDTRGQTQPPPFTGTDSISEMARARPGGPSTDPTSPRDRSWQNLVPGQSVSTRGNGPSTEPVGPSGLLMNDPRDASPATQRTASGGLSVNDSFGRMPAGLTLPDRTAEQRSPYPDRAAVGPPPLDTDKYARQPILPNRYAQQQPAQIRNSQNRDAPPTGDPGQLGGGFAGNGRENQQTPPSLAGPDSRLTAAQIAAGAWTIDAFGRVLDREGRFMASANPNPSLTSSPLPAATPSQPPAWPTNPLSQNPANGQPATLGRPNALGPQRPTYDDRMTSQTYDSPAADPSFAEPTGRDPATIPYQRRVDQPIDRDAREIAPYQPTRSAALPPDVRQNRRPVPDSRGTGAIGDVSAHSSTNQPFFNILLLLSFVANVYLAFWLKNLRVQFHDLVAAKRMANSNGTQA